MGLRFILYNIVTLFALPIVLVFLGLGQKHRKGLLQRLGFIPEEVREKINGERPVWLHAVSVGEVIASIPILKEIKKNYPRLKIVVSTITVTGNYTVQKKIPEVDVVIYFPYDYYYVVRKVIRAIDPCIFIHTETEIWPNFLWVLSRRGIPSVIVNGRLSDKSSRRYKALSWFFRNVFDKIAAFGVQSQVDYERVVSMGVDPNNVLLTGYMKYDQNIAEAMELVQEDVLNSLNLSGSDEIFIAGSTHAGEEEIVLNVFRQLLQSHPRLVLILAPRHPERFQEVEKLIKRRGLVVRRKTTIDNDCKPEGRPHVILLDTIGELSRVYGIGDAIFVGGSLVNIGGHNILEPVVHKKPAIFGPWMQNFTEITTTIKESGAGIQVNSEDELLDCVKRFLNSKKEARRLGEQGFKVIQRHQGATDRNMEIINRFIGDGN
jgi:3-deoxy-D-manno-octulosonic-acid transferase